MQIPEQVQNPRRRDVLHTLAAACASLSLSAQRGIAAPGKSSNNKRFWGIFPIAQTPFTESNKLDVDSLREELKFIDRGRVHGFVWPQLASEWDTLSESARMEGADAIAAAGQTLRPAIVWGVQGPNVAAAVKYAKHAAKAGADAIISLPPSG